MKIMRDAIHIKPTARLFDGIAIANAMNFQAHRAEPPCFRSLVIGLRKAKQSETPMAALRLTGTENDFIPDMRTGLHNPAWARVAINMPVLAPRPASGSARDGPPGIGGT
ncbi:MAG: hypothetical protein ACK45D_09310 [Alphaproteobacteria bacterium]